MDIVLLILKIIGIILLSIIGLILFIILVALITPVRYRIKGKYAEEKPDVLLNIHLWFHLISVKVVYNEVGLNGKLRILFIKKNLIKPKEEKTDSPVDENLIQNELDQMEAEALSQLEQANEVVEEQIESSSEETDIPTEDNSEPDTAEQIEASDVTVDDTIEESVETEEQTIIDKIVAKIKGIYEKVHEKYVNIMKKKTAVEWLLSQEATQNLIKRALRQLKKTIKSVLPRKLKGHLTLGLEDPKTMGMICMYSGIFYPSLPKKFEFEPVFDEKIIDGDVDIKGRIILGAIVAHLLKIALCRDFFRTLKNLKRFKKLWR